MNKANIILQTIRMPFLVLTPVCVFFGVSIVIFVQGSINMLMLALASIGALLAHISVNTLNEYLDFKSGLDLITKRTAFSGGSGALVQYPEMLGAVLNVGILSLLMTLTIGGFFIWKFGMGILPIGLLGVFLVMSYTRWINKYPFLCLIAPGFGFGFLFVVGTQYVMVGHYLPLAWMLAVIPFFLVNNLLLLNQYPDIDADKKSGRNHFPIAYGICASNFVYGFFILATVVAIVIYVIMSYIPYLSLMSLIPVPLAVFALSGAIKHGADIGKYPKYLAANVIVTLLVPLFLAVSILL